MFSGHRLIHNGQQFSPAGILIPKAVGFCRFCFFDEGVLCHGGDDNDFNIGKLLLDHRAGFDAIFVTGGANIH